MESLKNILSRIEKRIEDSKQGIEEIEKAKADCMARIAKAEEAQRECLKKKNFEGYKNAQDKIAQAAFELESAKMMEADLKKNFITQSEYRNFINDLRGPFKADTNAEWKEILKHYREIKKHLDNIQGIEDRVNDVTYALAKACGMDREIMQSYPGDFRDVHDSWEELERTAARERW